MMGNEVLVRYMYRQVYSQPSVHVYPYYTCDLVLTSTINSLKNPRRTDDARRKKVGSAIHSEYGYRTVLVSLVYWILRLVQGHSPSSQSESTVRQLQLQTSNSLVVKAKAFLYSRNSL